MNEAGRQEIKMAHENGFEIGNHSWGWDSVSSKENEIKDSIGKTNAVLKGITGYSNFLFRAPNLAKPIADGQNLDGSIILMHEFNTKTYQTINEVIEYYQKAGYQIVSVSELFALKGKELTTGKIYTSAQ